MKNKCYICLFGSGKTYFSTKYSNWADLDFGCIFPVISLNKYKRLKEAIEAGKNILLNVSSITASIPEKYPEILDLLDIVVVLPENSPEMKEEIFKRCENRVDHDSWFTETYLPQNYDAMWKLANNLPFPKVYLKPGQYLTDIITKNGNLKQGIDLE